MQHSKKHKIARRLFIKFKSFLARLHGLLCSSAVGFANITFRKIRTVIVANYG